MYGVLMDAKTKTYFMDPGQALFHAFSDPSQAEIRKKNSRLVETDIDDVRELETMLYNAGFFRGYLDGKPYRLSKQRIYFYDRNPNEIAYAQYQMTKDEKYLELLKKNKLYTLCKIQDTSIYFPTVPLENGEKAVLTYTSLKRISQEMRDKYDGWRTVHMNFDARYIINGEVLLDI